MMRAAILAAGTVALALLAAVCLPRHLPSAPASETVTPASFHAHLEHGTLTLRGSLPSETSKAAILQRAQELYGAAPGRIVDGLAVDSKVKSEAWIANVPKALPILGYLTERGSIIVDGHSIVLSGQVDGDRTKATVLREVAPLTQMGLELENHILVAQLSAPASSLQKKLNEVLAHASIEFDSNTATITPRSRATLDQLITHLRRSPHTAIEIGGHTDKYGAPDYNLRSEEHTSELQSHSFISYAVFCLKKHK